MVCPKCGAECREGARFCNQCGAEMNPPEPPKKGKLWWKVLLIVSACAVVVIAIFFGRREVHARQFQNHMEAGQTYLQNGEYEEAVVEFTSAIEIEPEEVEPYDLLAETYVGLGDLEQTEATYDDARTMILDTYDQTVVLPDGAKDLYLDAIKYYGEKDDPDTVEELQNEISPLLENASDKDEISEAVDQAIRLPGIALDDAQSEEDIHTEGADELDWGTLYSDYIEAEYDYEESDYYFIYLNDDDVPELLVSTNGPAYLLLYIQDLQVKEESAMNPYFADRGGYIVGTFSEVFYDTMEEWFLDSEGQMTSQFSGFIDYGLGRGEYNPDDPEYQLDGEEVSEDEFNRKFDEAFHWTSDGEHILITTSDMTNALLFDDTQEIYATPFATSADEAISVLRSGSEALSESVDAANHTFAPEDMETAIEHIRDVYYKEIQANDSNYAKTTVRDGVVRYVSPDGRYVKCVVAAGTDGNAWSREYYYEDGELIFAFYHQGGKENRFYFYDEQMIRWIDENATTHDLEYENTSWSPWEQKVLAEKE